MLSADMFKIISNFEIDDFNPLFSDVHCMLDFTLSAITMEGKTDPTQYNPRQNTKIKWNNDRKDSFIAYIENEDDALKTISDTINNLMDKEQELITSSEVNDIVNKEVMYLQHQQDKRLV